LLSNNCPDDYQPDTSLVDSLPNIKSSGKRPNAVTKELTDKGFCSTKNMYCHGLKLNASVFPRPDHLPFPESPILTPASENDLNFQKQFWSNFYYRTFYGEKIYSDADFFKRMTESYNSGMLIPIKAIKGQSQTITQINKAANDLYSTAVSKIRQPIEALFNWLIEKPDIQRVFKVSSTKGLVVHIFGRIAAAYIFLIFND